MALIIDSARFTNAGTVIGGVTMSDRNNYFDTTKGIVSGKVSLLGGNDTFLGGVRSEVVDGGTGNDRLAGGLGKDILTGGEGKDAFIFNVKPSSANADVIRDFKSVDDTFQLKKSIFLDIGPKGKLQADAFHLGAKAADAQDRIIFNKVTGQLFYDADGTGPEAQIRIATLTNKEKLVLSDFLIV